ncbi:helix-turn-helix transcriptional regulator [Pyramidobacter sp.]|uniref:helix-turn-helix domain-containing protein n=1 Tax=Pyramidobacter sp. TaxID=1943581 RepID=UPI003329F2E8
MNIGTLIKQKRREHGVSQNELAERSGMSRSTIINFEAGKRSPRVDDLQNIALALGEDELYFFTLNPPLPPTAAGEPTGQKSPSE